MALTATIYNLTVELSDIDRGVYETLELRVARQPSETGEYMLMRVLAYCLEYAEGIAFTEGVASGDEPAVLVRDLTGRITTWVEVGMPDADRLHRASKHAGRVALYTHRDIRQVLENLNGKKIHRADELPVYAFDPHFMSAVSAKLERRTKISLSVTEKQMYLDIGGTTFESVIDERRIA